MKKIIMIIMILILGVILYNIQAQEKKDVKKEVKEKLVNCPDKPFGININELTAKKLLNILKIKKKKYKVYFDEDWPGVPYVVTDYFVGQGIDKSKIREVYYDFWPTDVADITIVMEIGYLNELVNKMKKIYGEPTEYIIKGNEINIRWECNEQSRSSIKFISIYNDEEKGVINLLIRPIKAGCGHAH